MELISVGIITPDSVVAVGLKHLLSDLFDIEAVVYDSVDSLKGDEQANYDLLISEPALFAAAPGFFLPRRSRLLLLADTDVCDDGQGYMLNRRCSEEELIRRLSATIGSVKESIATGNGLSQREVDVLCLVASGLTNKEIADRLCISVNTVLTHRKNITAKLGIKSVSGLSVYAMMNGYIGSNQQV